MLRSQPRPASTAVVSLVFLVAVHRLSGREGAADGVLSCFDGGLPTCTKSLFEQQFTLSIQKGGLNGLEGWNEYGAMTPRVPSWANCGQRRPPGYNISQDGPVDARIFVKTGDVAPNFALKSLATGEVITLSSLLKTKPTVIEFGAFT